MSTVRFPNLLLTRAKKAAEEKGMSFNDLLVHALERELGGISDPTIGFLDDVRAWLQSRFSESFPEDVTLRTFQHIRETPTLFMAYNHCIVDAVGIPDAKRRSGLHRRIGLLVRRTLKAKVYGSSLPVKSHENLISNYRLLRAPALLVGKPYWNGLPFPAKAERLSLPDGRVLEDAVVWPDFCQDELGINPELLWSELTALPEWPSDKEIVFRDRGDDPQWITGEQRALNIRGHTLKRDKIWFQSDYENGLLRYGYSGWQHRISYATHDIEYAPSLTRLLTERLNKGLSKSGHQLHNHWIVTRYENQEDNIGMHSDKDKDFAPDSFFIVIKFGAPRRFAFQLPDKRKPFYDQILKAGTAIFVRCKGDNAANDLVLHGVPVTNENVGSSGSIVGRCIITRHTWAEVHREVRIRMEEPKEPKKQREEEA